MAQFEFFLMHLTHARQAVQLRKPAALMSLATMKSNRGNHIMQYIHILLLIFLFHSINTLASPPQSSSSAKKAAHRVYADYQKTFYCGCDYHKIEGKLRVDWSSCDYQPRKNANRARRVEWEHVVPAWWLGHQRQCWQNGGRKNCRKYDPVFRQAEADLHNLVPAIGEVNGDRSNYRFGMIEGEQRRYGQCDFEVDFKARKAEPKAEIRGDIARIYFYMSSTYGIKFSQQQQQLLEAWSQEDPVDEWEQERERRITEVVGDWKQEKWRVSHLTGKKVIVEQTSTPSPESETTQVKPTSHTCSTKRYCKEMSSCSEARYYLEQCGRTRLDGDKDGIPCEALCR